MVTSKVDASGFSENGEGATVFEQWSVVFFMFHNFFFWDDADISPYQTFSVSQQTQL